MRIERNGIVLHRLQYAEIELLRKWRNSDKIRKFMLFQEEITPRMQQDWFHQINNENNFYFLIGYQHQKIGLINLAQIDWQQKTAFAGLFIYEETYWGTFVPVLASLSMLDIFFTFLKLDEIKAKVAHSNQAAIRYNEYLGFKNLESESHENAVMLSLSADDYMTRAASLKKTAKKLYGNTCTIDLSDQYPGFEFIEQRFKELIADDLAILGAKIRFSR